MNQPRETPSDLDAAGGSGPPPIPRPPSDPASEDPRVASYLDQVFAPLAALIPETSRRELRLELAAHLEALIEAHRELGSEPEAAVRAALSQLGDPHHLALEWARVWIAPTRSALAVGKLVLCAAVLLAGAAFGTTALVTLEHQLGHNLFELAVGGPALPLIAGAMVGALHGRHPLGSRWGLALITLASVFVSMTMTTADPRPPIVTVIRITMWLMSACGTAGLGVLAAQWRDRWGSLLVRH